jgi:hypothetical protein
MKKNSKLRTPNAINDEQQSTDEDVLGSRYSRKSAPIGVHENPKLHGKSVDMEISRTGDLVRSAKTILEALERMETDLNAGGSMQSTLVKETVKDRDGDTTPTETMVEMDDL